MAISPLALPEIISYTKEPIIILLQTDIDQSSAKTSVEIFLYLHYATGDICVIQEEFADSTGKIAFYVDALLDEAIKHETTIPVKDGFSIYQLNSGLLEWSVAYVEYTDFVLESEGVLNDINNSGENYLCLNGGYSYEALQTGHKFWTEYFIANTPALPFLSWLGTNRLVDKDSPGILYYFNKDVEDKLVLHIILYNGLTPIDVEPDYFHVDSPVKNKLYAVYCGYNKLDIDGWKSDIGYTGQVTHWKMWLKNEAGTAVSEALNFYYSQKEFPNKVHLLFENSLGGWDDVFFTGEYDIKADYERNDALYKGDTATMVDQIRRVYSVRENAGKKFNTGPLSKNMIHLLRQMLLTEQMMEQTDGLLLSVELTEKAKDLIKTAKLNSDLTLEFRYNFRNKVYTPLNRLG